MLKLSHVTKEVNEELNRYITRVGLEEQSFFELPAKNLIILRISSNLLEQTCDFYLEVFKGAVSEMSRKGRMIFVFVE